MWASCHTSPMENRHNEALRRIAQADGAWAREGHEPRTFLLLHPGGTPQIDHPRWDDSWSTPGSSTIDDLRELGFLRVAPVDASRNKARTFELTMAGREKARGLAAQQVAPVGEPEPEPPIADPTPQAPSPVPDPDPGEAPVAFVSWAHGDGDWQATVAEFAFELRKLGIDADIDLIHLQDRAVNWTTYGPRAIQESDFVLIVVSAAYKERWEDTNAPGTGAGAAREANTLKTLFGDNQEAFYGKVKIVILPGVTTDDIPTELKAVVHRFPIATIDRPGLEGLLRVLTDQPEFVAPPVGTVPLLPPKPVGQSGKPLPVPEPSQAVAAAIAELPDREKLIIALTYFERMTRTEIAEILGVSQNEISQLAQDATTRLGHSVSAGLVAGSDRPATGQNHSARHALLADGPRLGELLPIGPGQLALAIPERFDFDQGYAEVTDHYAYEGRTVSDPDTLVFRFRHQEHRVVTDG
jgi:hypothetical protein